MTLAEWSAQSGIPVQDIAGGTCVALDYQNPLHPELWNLSDYFVSSVMCGTVWLMPKNDPGDFPRA